MGATAFRQIGLNQHVGGFGLGPSTGSEVWCMDMYVITVTFI